MGKKEKYYNYIVDDLVKKTKIIYSPQNTMFNRVLIPFAKINRPFSMTEFKGILSRPVHKSFIQYIAKMYGAQDTGKNNDAYPLWKLYVEKMKEKLG